VEGSVKVFPVPDYGAIISGEHLFYIVENSTERLDGLATFVHVWQYKNGEWKMSRVLSYDHRPAPSTNLKEAVSLSDEVLIQYVGSYEGKDNRSIVISKEEDHLKLKDGKFEVNIYPESEVRFFHKERDLQFDFIKDNEQMVIMMVVYEKGVVVEEANWVE